jgi:integrase
MRTRTPFRADLAIPRPLFDIAQYELFGTVGSLSTGRASTRQELLQHQRMLLLVAALSAMDADRLPLEKARSLGLNALQLQYSGAPATAAKYVKEASRFFKQLQASGVEFFDEIEPDHADAFFWGASTFRGRLSDVSATTASNRRSIIQSLLREFEHLGITPACDLLGPSIRRGHAEPARLLTDREVQRIRNECTGGFLFTFAPWFEALSEAGATAVEIAEVRGADVDLDRGVVRFSGRSARYGPLSDWGVNTLRLVVAQQSLVDDKRVCCGDDLGPERAAHSVTAGMHRILRDAGFARDRQVSARSIRHTFARRVLEESGIEAAALFLGSDSLDATARALAHEWRVA